ncbi:MAG TPA: hypothetical protein DCZ88_11505, partial [Pseudanabaena sp.]|nr:hypothetical protein [Pseudanabaena sp.]
EYSDAAIASRKRIIDKAYELLIEHISAPKDQKDDVGDEISDRANNRPVTTLPPQVEADEKDFAGLLLILSELGESEKVLS